MAASQRANLVLKFATSVKEAAVAQEAVAARYCPVVGSANNAIATSRNNATNEVNSARNETFPAASVSDIKDQNARTINGTYSKSQHVETSSRQGPVSIESLFSSKTARSGIAQSLQLGMQQTGSAQNLLPPTALVADNHGTTHGPGRSFAARHPGGPIVSCKPMLGNSSSFHAFSRPKSTTSNLSIGFNKQIMTAADTSELLNLVQKVGPQLDFFNISSALSRVPKLVAARNVGNIEKQQPLGSVETQLVNSLAALMEEKLQTFDARGLANAAWALGKLRYSPKHLPALITQRSMEKIQEFTPQNLSNMLWSHVYLQHRDETFLKAAASRVRAHIADFKPQELSNVVWAFASLDYRDSELLRDASKQTMQLLDSFKEQELSNLVWAFARSEHRDAKLFSALLQPVMAKVPTLSPQGVSNIAWGLSHVGLPNAAFLKAVSRHWTGRLNEFDPQALSTLTWALGAAGVKIDPLLIGLMDECLRCRDQLAPQHLSNVLWACATLNFYYGPMLAPWAEAAMRAADHFEPQGLSNILWAFAKLGHFESRLMDRLADTLLSGKVDACSAQGLSNIVWAYATAGHPHTPLLNRLAERMAKAAPSFSAQNCSVSLWGLATLRHFAPETFALVLKRLSMEIQSGSRTVEPQNVANTLWACARLGHDLGSHTEVLRDRALKLATRMRQQELCNCFWALAVLDCLDLDSFDKFAGLVGNAGGLSTEGLHQAFHAQLLFHSFLSRNAPATPQPYPTLPEPLDSLAAAAWRRSASDVRISRLQQDVSCALDVANIPNRLEVLTKDALFSIDIVVEAPGAVPTALEVDGVHHFTSNVPSRPLRDVIMRRRLLQDRGWNVVNLGVQQWNELPGATSKEKAPALKEYIMRELGLTQLPPSYLAINPQLPKSTNLPASLSLESLPYPTYDPCGSSSPLPLTIPLSAPSLPHDLDASQYSEDTTALLQQLIALAPTLGCNSSTDLATDPMNVASLPPSLPTAWLQDQTSYPASRMLSYTSLPQQAPNPFYEVPSASMTLSMLSSSSTTPSPGNSSSSLFQPLAAPSSPPQPRTSYPFRPPANQSLLPLPFLMDQTSALPYLSFGLGSGLNWDAPAADPNASLINSLLQSLSAAQLQELQAMQNPQHDAYPMPTPCAIPVQTYPSVNTGNYASVLDAFLQSKGAALASNSNASMLQGVSMYDAMQHRWMHPTQVASGLLRNAQQTTIGAKTVPCGEGAGLGWTVWSGLPPVLSVGANML